jgi:hypothetical protein
MTARVRWSPRRTEAHLRRPLKLLGFVVVDPVTRKVTRRVELGTCPRVCPSPTATPGPRAPARRGQGCGSATVSAISSIAALGYAVAQIRTGHFRAGFALRRTAGDLRQPLVRTRWRSTFSRGRYCSNMQFELGSGPKRIAIGKRVKWRGPASFESQCLCRTIDAGAPGGEHSAAQRVRAP